MLGGEGGRQSRASRRLERTSAVAVEDAFLPFRFSVRALLRSG